MSLRNWALATVSLMALGMNVGAANAATKMMGEVNLGFGFTWDDYDYNPADNDYTSAFGGARVNLPYTDTVNLQLDALGRASLDDSQYDGDGSSTGNVGVGAHVHYRDAQGLLGIFAATGRVYDAYYPSAPFFLAGFEGQYYLTNWTFYAQGGYADSQDPMLEEAAFLRGVATYYYTRRLKFSAELGYYDGETFANGGETGIDARVLGWGLAAEYMFGTRIPASVFLKYNAHETTWDNGGSDDTLEANTVSLGFRFLFGGDDLQTADRDGASVDLPDLDVFRGPAAAAP